MTENPIVLPTCDTKMTGNARHFCEKIGKKDSSSLTCTMSLLVALHHLNNMDEARNLCGPKNPLDIGAVRRE